MTFLTPAEIEQSLLPYRINRRFVCTLVLEYIISAKNLMNPFLLLSRLFVRLKSADSILEKIRRKGLVVNTVSDIGKVMHDLLGFRIITDNLEDLWAFDQFLTTSFEVKSRTDTVSSAGQYGYRSIEYGLLHHDADTEVPFEVQLRTQLQHYWASSSFFLFHKAPPYRALEYEGVLTALSNVLVEAEHLAAQIGEKEKTPALDSERRPDPQKLPVCSQINLIVVEPGERFVRHERLLLSGDDLRDHQAIVERKVALYAEYAGAAIVECSCMNFITFALNEPQVMIPLEKLDQIMW